MNMGNLSIIEFLQDIQNLDGFKKELFLDLGNEKKFLSVYYKFYPFPRDIFNIFFVKENELLDNEEYLKKGKKCQLAITVINWIQSGGELKASLGKKKFIDCQIIDVRKDFIKIKIIL
jgi:hypothetical protein